ncbi:MAG: glycoside hydrolase family 88 protein [Ignavibacteriaceae bacterium]|nr:glycoside hydrolase family 88 protein [Ignavibacteriaceae bacterium]
MHKNFFLWIIISSLFNFSSIAQIKSRTEKILTWIADDIVKSTKYEFIDEKADAVYKTLNHVPSHAKLKLQSPYNDWRYWNGVLNIALLKLGSEFNKPIYSEFVKRNIKFTFENYTYFYKNYNAEGKWVYPFGQFFIMEELDDCGSMGASVIEVYNKIPKTEYLEYINRTSKHILNKQARLDDGTLVRSFPRKWTLWADDLYMSISFLCRMGELTGDHKYFDDAANQVLKFHKYLFDEKKGLMYHCWYSDVEQNGVAFWGRANGWAILAQIDLLDRLPKNYKHRERLLALFKKHILGISKYQDKSGLWNQLLDKSDSFLETSCTAMFTYAIARGINKNYLDKNMKPFAEKGWAGILTRINKDGKIEGICAGTGVSDDLKFYYERPTPLHDIHGIGAVLLAGSEILKLLIIKD